MVAKDTDHIAGHESQIYLRQLYDLGKGATPSEGPGWGEEEPGGGESKSLVNPRGKVFPSPRKIQALQLWPKLKDLSPP